MKQKTKRIMWFIALYFVSLVVVGGAMYTAHLIAKVL